MAAPLMVGNDPSTMSASVKAILTNTDVIAVDQDALGKPGQRLATSGQTEVWSKPMQDGSVAVVLFNRGTSSASVSVSWSAIGISGSSVVRDLWQHADKGAFEASYTVTVPRHDVVMIRVYPPGVTPDAGATPPEGGAGAEESDAAAAARTEDADSGDDSSGGERTGASDDARNESVFDGVGSGQSSEPPSAADAPNGCACSLEARQSTGSAIASLVVGIICALARRKGWPWRRSTMATLGLVALGATMGCGSNGDDASATRGDIPSDDAGSTSSSTASGAGGAMGASGSGMGGATIAVGPEIGLEAGDTFASDGATKLDGGVDAASAGSSDCGALPVAPDSSSQARKVLCFLYNEYGHHILSGQEEGGGDAEINYVHTNTGKYPAIRSFDLLNSGVPGRCSAWWKAGGICMIGYHMGAPTHPDNYQGSQMSVSIDRVLTAGTPENTSFLQRLDNAAGQLLQIQNAGAMAIWRPFHEAGGTWFWWSQEGGAQYVRLWKYMFDYFTRTKGVHAALWLHPYDGSPSAAFYPGKAYVDIAGADNYVKDYGPMTSLFDSVRTIVGSTIPIALHENGPIPDPDQLQATSTRWLLFNTWTDIYITQQNSVTQLKKTYSSAYVLTRDELPSFE